MNNHLGETTVSRLDRYLFRGISRESGEWVYGSFIPKGIKVERGDFPYEGPAILGEWCDDEVHEESVGMWTGHKDVNKVNMFEGDTYLRTIKQKPPHMKPIKELEVRGVVKWHHETALFVLEEEGGALRIHPDMLQIKVIGSIHDRLLAGRS